MPQITVARHVETEKNLRNIHGTSTLDGVTQRGRQQVDSLARAVRRQGIGVQGVVSTPTPQAIVSARLLADAIGVPYQGELSLQPIDLGVASGKSTAELLAVDPVAHQMMDRFRARVITASELKIAGAEGAETLQQRLLAWWMVEGRSRLPNRLVVGSNSTVLMITHLLNGILPTEPRYRFLAIPNGTARVWSGGTDTWSASPAVPTESWPDMEQLRIESRHGMLAATRHVPSWAPRKHAIIIIPGYFGSSRHGPYGLYNRLAKAWAWHGFETLTIDPLGSGDSTPVFRDYESDVRSVEIACDWVSQRTKSLVLVGHSMGGATALSARQRITFSGCRVWCLAPLCRLVDLSRTFLTTGQLAEIESTGSTYRHGLELRREMIDHSGAAWDTHCPSVDAVWIAGDDQYTAGMDLSQIPHDRISTIVGADHNFSRNENVPQLLESTGAHLEGLGDIIVGGMS